MVVTEAPYTTIVKPLLQSIFQTSTYQEKRVGTTRHSVDTKCRIEDIFFIVCICKPTLFFLSDNCCAAVSRSLNFHTHTQHVTGNLNKNKENMIAEGNHLSASPNPNVTRILTLFTNTSRRIPQRRSCAGCESR